MLSRRSFLLGNLAGLASIAPGFYCSSAWAKKVKVEPVRSGPHSLARVDWPPAIVPDRIGIADKGFCCIADEYGRLAIVDLRKPSNPKTPPKVVAELGGLGKKVVDFKVFLTRAYALVLSASESPDAQYSLIVINLSSITDPSILTKMPLDRFSEALCVAASAELVCVAGTSTSGENLVSIFAAGNVKGSKMESTPLSSVTTDLPVSSMDLQDRNLLVLESGANSQLQYFGLIDPRTPVTRGTIKLDGDFKAMARFKDAAIVAGTTSALSPSGGTCVAKSIALEPKPRVVLEVNLDPLSNVFDASAQKDRFMIFGESSSDRMLASFICTKTKAIIKEQVVTLPKQSGGYGSHSSVALSGKNVYVASGWAGIQMLSQVGTNWTFAYNYTIPRLPASSLATWGDSVVLAGADLKLYDIQHPAKPTLAIVASLSSSVKSVVGAGSFVLCLTKDSMLLRKMDKLNDTVATVKIVGQQVCFDKTQQRAYVLRENPKKTTTLSKLQVYSNSLSIDKVYDVAGTFARASANGSAILLGGLNDVSLYKLGDTADLVGSRHFENLGVRDVVLLDDFIVIAAIDQSSKGFCLILSKDEKDLHVLGSIDLPHDGVALAAFNRTAVVIGRTPEGKDLATFVDFRTPATPKIITSVPTVEAASAVTMKEQLAIVAGRGMDLLSLT